MALTQNDRTRKIYLSIINGKFAQKVDKDTANAVERKNKKDVMVHELMHDKASGFIKEVKVEKNDLGKQLIIVMEEIGEVYVISIPVESKYFDSFCSKIGSVNLSESLELAPYSFEGKDGKKHTGLNIYQNGNKMAYFFSNDDPKGKPMVGEERLDDVNYKIFKLQERDFFCKYIGEGLKMNQKKEDVYPNSQMDSLSF